MRSLSTAYRTANEVAKEFANKRIQVEFKDEDQLASFIDALGNTGFRRFAYLIDDEFDDIVDTINSKGSATIRLADDKQSVKWTSKPAKHKEYNNAYAYVTLPGVAAKKSVTSPAPVFTTKKTATPSIKSYKKGDSIMKKTTNKLFANLIPAFVTDNSIALSSTGAIAVRRPSGDYVRYDAAQGAIVNDNDLVLDLGVDKMFILMPSKDVKAGDIVKTDKGYFAVTSVANGSVTGINLNDGISQTLIPEKNIIIGAMNYFVVQNLFAGLTGTSTGADFISNPLMLMALTGNGGAGSDNDLAKMLMFSTLGKGGDIASNPMMLMALAGDGDMDMSKMLMFSMLGKNGAADTNALLPLMLLGDGNMDTNKLLMFSMMSGGKGLDFASNPMMAMALLGGDSFGGGDDMGKMLLFSQMAGGTTGAGAIDPMMLMLLGGNGSDDTMKTFALMQMMQQGGATTPKKEVVDVTAKEVPVEAPVDAQ